MSYLVIRRNHKSNELTLVRLLRQFDTCDKYREITCKCNDANLMSERIEKFRFLAFRNNQLTATQW